MARYQILYWQDIPSQIKAWDDFDEVSVEMPARFGARIDRVAQSTGLTETDAYLEHWKWGEELERDGSPNDVAQAVKEELDERFR